MPSSSAGTRSEPSRYRCVTRPRPSGAGLVTRDSSAPNAAVRSDSVPAAAARREPASRPVTSSPNRDRVLATRSRSAGSVPYRRSSSSLVIRAGAPEAVRRQFSAPPGDQGDLDALRPVDGPYLLGGRQRPALAAGQPHERLFWHGFPPKLLPRPSGPGGPAGYSGGSRHVLPEWTQSWHPGPEYASGISRRPPAAWCPGRRPASRTTRTPAGSPAGVRSGARGPAAARRLRPGAGRPTASGRR